MCVVWNGLSRLERDRVQAPSPKPQASSLFLPGAAGQEKTGPGGPERKGELYWSREAGASSDVELNVRRCVGLLAEREGYRTNGASTTLSHLAEQINSWLPQFAWSSHRVSTAGGAWHPSVVLFANRAPQRSATTPASPDSRTPQHLTTLRRPRYDTR